MYKVFKTLVVSLVFGLATIVAATEIKFDQGLAQAHCTDKWTKRGVLDGDMFSYCMEGQTEGYGKSLELYNKYSNIERVELIDEVVSFALKKWAKRNEYQMDMVAYEIEQQGEAYLNVAYELSTGNVNPEQLETCKSKWIEGDKPDWSMVEYCLNK